MKKKLLSTLLILVLIISCKKSDNNVINGNSNAPNPNATDVATQDFIWRAMNLWYFWQDDVANLADTKFPNTPEGITTYTEFLKSEDTPEDFLKNKLLHPKDRFTFYNSDYKKLVNNLSGISKSNGVEFGLLLIADNDEDNSNNNVYGYVRYIIPNSDASSKDIKRGDIFTGVNGQTLNYNNFRELLFSNADSYTLNMADIVDGTIINNKKNVSLTKEEGVQENPIFMTKTFNINGEKIGYLVYNGFLRNFDKQLNDAFATFKAENITDLVLDLRYNPGGSVNSSRLLASMIYGTKTKELYIKQRWNNKIQSQLDASDIEDYFASKTSDGSNINTLNLSKVYIIATNSSASSSELVMNGLAPYINVVHIGEKTTGKNRFSITLVDDPNNSSGPYVYSAKREKNINTNNRWGLQPLVGRNENSVGFYDYTDGLIPDIELPEDLENLGALGDVNEPLLARAIQEITGANAKRDFTVKTPIKAFTNSKMYTAVKDNMYIDKELNIIF